MRAKQRFVLYRILGNDLPPRHDTGHTLANLRFTLDHEPPLEGCERRWVVNRIVDPGIEAQITGLLDERGQRYLRVPFVEAEYSSCQFDFEGMPTEYFFYRKEFHALTLPKQYRVIEWCYRRKNLYLMNVNAARNAALREGRALADWVMPFDGACFFIEAAWASVLEAADRAGSAKYLIVPIARVLENERLLDPAYRPESTDEPQLAFRRDAGEAFDEALRYGTKPKTTLLNRLGVPGPWQRPTGLDWDKIDLTPSPEAGQYVEAGWVARLASGNPEGDADNRTRNPQRWLAIVRSCVRADARIVRRGLSADRLCFFDEAVLDRERRAWLAGEPALVDLVTSMRLLAERALDIGRLSVVDKTTLPPSGDPHDYWSMAPYWWPDPGKPDGLPYVWKDGEGRPDTELFGPASDRYDRSRLQRLLDHVTVLALSWYFTREDRFVRHAADLLRAWFIAPATRMNPHLRYAQVRTGHGQEGTGAGIVEIRDLVHALDAIRLVLRSGAFAAEDATALRAWFRAFVNWLRTSGQGRYALGSANNVGTCYDLHIAAIAVFLDDMELFCDHLNVSRMRIAQQIRPDGTQPNESRRTRRPLHYELFNLQLWANLARLARAAGADLWGFETREGCSLAQALTAVAARMNGVASSDLSTDSARIRLEVLRALAPETARGADELRPDKYRLPACLHPDAAVAPFWALGLATY